MAKSTHKFNYDLSICMIVKNEEKYIERCLKALQPLRELINCELIITDTGSTDRTIEIINEYADKVIHFEWCNDFAKARNTGIEACTGRWIMTLDADEIFDESIVKIADFMNMKDRDKYNASNVIMYNLKSEEENAEELGYFRTTKLVNFKDGKRFFQGAIHESIPVVANLTYNIDAIINHYGYLEGVNEIKIERNRPLLTAEYEKNPNDLRIISLISNQAGANPEYKNQDIDILERGVNLDLSTTKNKIFIKPLHVQLARAYYDNAFDDRFFDLAKKYLDIYKEDDNFKLEFYYMYYSYYYKNSPEVNNIHKAVYFMKQYVKLFEHLQKNPDYISLSLVMIKTNNIKFYYEICFNLAIHYGKNSDLENTRIYYKKSKSYECSYGNNTLDFIYRYVELGFQLGCYEDLFEMYKYLNNNNTLEDLELKKLRYSMDTAFLNMNKSNSNKICYSDSNNVELGGSNKQEFLKIFSQKFDNYTALNYIRLNNYNLSLCNKDNLRIILVDDNILSECGVYSDLLYASFKSNLDLFGFMDRYSVSAINEFINNIYINHENFIDELEKALDSNEFTNNTDNFFNNIFNAQACYMYMKNNLEDIKSTELDEQEIDRYEKMFKGFIENTYFSLDKIRANQVTNEYFKDLMPYQEFCVHLYEATQNKSEEEIKIEDYLEIIQDALNYCPEFIDICNGLASIKLGIDNNSSGNIEEKTELELLLNTIKETIYSYINDNDLRNARLILNEYIAVNPTDPEIDVIKRKIELM